MAGGRFRAGYTTQWRSVGRSSVSVELLLAGVGIEFDGEADMLEADRHVLRQSERAAEIQLALGLQLAIAPLDSERGCDGVERYAGAGDQRFE